MRDRVLVTGSTGVVGRLVRDGLLRRGVPVTVLVRTSRHAVAAEQMGARAIIGDFAAPDTLEPAMVDARAMFLSCAAHPEQVTWQRGAVCLARDAGIEQVVKLSAGRASADSAASIKRWHWQTEQDIAASGLVYTHLRPNGFMQNFLRFRERIVADGAFSAPTGAARVSFIDAADIADAALAALEAPAAHAGRIYELTGAESMTYADASAQISAAIGREVRFADETREDFRRRAIARGEPSWFVPYLLEIFDFIRSGAAADVFGDLPRVTGRPPRTLRQFASEHAAMFTAPARRTRWP
jgi:uncharacterized protein YbjT (DUF2867 family)